ncbi:hypothetical protein Brms1b_004032 [Colletotrichum noveboracense]|nr:hypothetical protein CBS470a_005164 [Colletotrichum nupharicola]KAJ0319057.1 hypothetical protein Brms1b_004032 [Colletotrichum noveboracense]
MEDIEANIKSDCAAQIFAVFPDICPEYFEKTATELLYDVDKIIEEILGASSYPKKARPKSLKRKRESPAEKDEVSKVRQLYDFANRPPERAQIYISISKKVLSQDFPRATIKSITKLLAEHNNCLMQTYLALDEITRDWKSGKTKARFEFKKTRTPPNPELEPANLDGTIRDSTTPDRTRALEELRAARQVCEAEQSRRNSARAKVLEEENNFKQAQEEGTIAECGCCFDERPLNRMVHCDNPDAEHRAVFLDDKLQAALDRIEFEAALQAQGFENLSACPFCPYAADCPPVEEDKEFRGGKKGNCPLFEQTEVRHEKEVRQAEEEARQKVLAAKPKLNEGLLKFNMSEHVTKGEKKTRSMAHIERGPQVVQRRHAGVDPVGEAMRLHLDPDALAAEQRIQAVIAGEQAAWNNRLGLHQPIAQNPSQAQPPEQPKPVPNAAARAAPQAVNGLFGVPDAVANNNWNQLNMPPFGGGLDPFELDIGFELGLMAQQPANIDHSYPLSLFGAEANNPPVPGGMNFGNNAYGNPVNYVVQQPRDASELGRTRDNPLELD